jgi:hypothetical protein
MGKLSTSLKKIMSLYLLWSIFVIVYRFRFVQTKVPRSMWPKLFGFKVEHEKN